jgi:ankyrin repeat protein
MEGKTMANGRIGDRASSGRRKVGWIALALSLVGAGGSAAENPDPLLEAVRSGNLAAATQLVAGGFDVTRSGGDGMTALHWAAEMDDAAMTQLLLQAGASVEATTRIGHYTPLHVASKRGATEVVRLLLGAGADSRAVSSNTQVTPLHLAAASAADPALVRLLIEGGAVIDARESSSGQTPLMFAAGSGRNAAVKVLLDAGADPSLVTRVVDVRSQIAREEEARFAFQTALKTFQQEDGGDLDWKPSPAQVEAAIRAEREAFLSESNVDQGTPRRVSIREALVGRTGGLTALLHAVREGHTGAAIALLDGGAEIDQVSAGDATSPLLKATLNGHWDLALLLIERGANPNLVASTDGASPLFATLQTHWAAQSLYPQPRSHDRQQAEYMEVLGALLRAGADPNIQLQSHLWYWEYGFTRIGMDIGGATPFWRAAFAQDLEAMRLLAQYGADSDLPTKLPPVELRETRQLDGRAQEDSGLPPVPAGAPNAYPIHVAAGGGYTGLGAWTVRAVPDGFLPAVKFLVDELGADVNAVDWWGFTPLHYAASRGDNEMILYLVEKGADVTALTRLGQSPVDLTRGGQGGFFTRRAFPGAQALLESLGSPHVCLNVHFVGTGDTCHAAGTTSFEDLYGFPRTPLIERGKKFDRDL